MPRPVVRLLAGFLLSGAAVSVGNQPTAISTTAIFGEAAAMDAATVNSFGSTFSGDATLPRPSYYRGMAGLSAVNMSPFGFAWRDLSSGRYSVAPADPELQGGLFASLPAAGAFGRPTAISVRATTGGLLRPDLYRYLAMDDTACLLYTSRCV